MANNSPYRHYNFIDGVRGIAACLVMLQHSMENTGIEVLEKGHIGLSWLNLGEVGVVAFFFVSGFVIPLSLEKWNNIAHFWVNRVFRIYPLYIFTYFLAAALTASAGFWISQMPLNFLVHLFFVQGLFGNITSFISVAWTLALEAVWYVGFTFLFFFRLNKKIPALVGLSVAAGLAGCAIAMANLVRMPMGRLGLLLICVSGLLCLRRDQKDVSNRVFFPAIAALGVVIAIGLYVGFSLRPGTSPIAPSFVCIAISWPLGAALFFIPFFRRSWPLTNNGLVRYLGKISYSIYLLHGVVINLLCNLFRHSIVSGWYLVAIIAAVTIALSGVTYRFIEYPMISLSHALRPAK